MKKTRFLVLTGVSGAGKKTALHALEDLGFFCVENLPTPLVSSFVDFVKMVASGEAGDRYKSKCFALLLDCRDEHDFDNEVEHANQLIESGIDFSLIFLDAQDDVLLRRFKETRRPHPLVLQGVEFKNTQDAIEKEREILSIFREKASLVIDTTSFTPHDLKKRVEDYVGIVVGFEVRLQSFGFKHGLPNDSDLVVDVRFLANPHFVPELKEKNGVDEEVAKYVFANDEAKQFLDKYLDLIQYLIPKYQKEGKKSITISVGCTGGKHRSVAIIEKMSEKLCLDKALIKKFHRDL